MDAHHENVKRHTKKGRKHNKKGHKAAQQQQEEKHPIAHTHALAQPPTLAPASTAHTQEGFGGADMMSGSQREERGEMAASMSSGAREQQQQQQQQQQQLQQQQQQQQQQHMEIDKASDFAATTANGPDTTREGAVHFSDDMEREQAKMGEESKVSHKEMRMRGEVKEETVEEKFGNSKAKDKDSPTLVRDLHGSNGDKGQAYTLLMREGDIAHPRGGGPDSKRAEICDTQSQMSAQQQQQQQAHALPHVDRHAEMLESDMRQASADQHALQAQHQREPVVEESMRAPQSASSQTSDTSIGQWRGVTDELARATRSSSTISNPGSLASVPRTLSTMSHESAGQRSSSGGVAAHSESVTSTNANTNMSTNGGTGTPTTPQAMGGELIAPAGNNLGFGLRHFPGHPHVPRAPGGARFNTTNVSFVPGADLTPDGSSTDEEDTSDAARTRAAMRETGAGDEEKGGDGARGMDLDEHSQPRSLPSDASPLVTHLPRSPLHALASGTSVSGPGASNEQRAGERDWASTGQNVEFLAWKNPPPTTSSPGTPAPATHSPHMQASGTSSPGSSLHFSPAGPRRSGLSSNLAFSGELPTGPEDCVVTPDAAITTATVPIDHTSRDLRISPDAMRHEHMRGVLGQEDPIHTHHYYSSGDAGVGVGVGIGGVGANTQAQAQNKGKEQPTEMSTDVNAATGGGINGPDSEVARDPCHLAMGQ